MKQQLFLVAVAVAALAACGGKKESTMPDEESGEGDESSPADNSDSPMYMVPPEMAEEITRLLERKQRIISRCLADAVDRGEAPKNARGKLTLEIVIEPSGKAETVKVIKSSFEAQGVQDCVIGHVRAIKFPNVPKTYPTSYTYAFEAS